mmetsp:Transcript_26649/g.42269  ORF Transcript_26649/g.42269 Transcript_26649/m.42269 type:complete len:83 (-) Transcript_26649:521-769(-)
MSGICEQKRKYSTTKWCHSITYYGTTTLPKATRSSFQLQTPIRLSPKSFVHLSAAFMQVFIGFWINMKAKQLCVRCRCVVRC